MSMGIGGKEQKLPDGISTAGDDAGLVRPWSGERRGLLDNIVLRDTGMEADTVEPKAWPLKIRGAKWFDFDPANIVEHKNAGALSRAGVWDRRAGR